MQANASAKMPNRATWSQQRAAMQFQQLSPTVPVADSSAYPLYATGTVPFVREDVAAGPDGRGSIHPGRAVLFALESDRAVPSVTGVGGW
jgi:hypothetical protein